MGLSRYLLLLAVPGVFAQTAIKVVTGTAVAGGTGSATITITSPSATYDPTDVQWTMTYSSGVLSGMTLTAGSALAAAGKSLSCASGTGQIKCIAWGLNTKPIPNGVLANATFRVSLDSPVSSSTLGLVGTTAVSGTAKTVASTATGATLLIQPPPRISKLTCALASIITPTTTTCTVTLTIKAAEATKVSLGLGTNSAKVTIPSSVTVAAGAISAPFTVSAGLVAALSKALLVASLNGSSATFTLSLLP